MKSIRRQKKVAFAVISDGSSESGLQAVFTDVNLAKQYVSTQRVHSNGPLTAMWFRLTNVASVRLCGDLVDSPGTGQAKELKVAEAEVLGECNPEVYPVVNMAIARSDIHSV